MRILCASLIFWILGLSFAVYAQASPTVLDSSCETVRLPQSIAREVRLNGRLLDSTPIQMMDRLDLAWRREGIQIEYRIPLGECERISRQFLWVYRIGGPYRARVDGRPLQAVEPTASAQDHVYNGRMPALFIVPAGGRQLEITIDGMPFASYGLIDIKLGPGSALSQDRTWDRSALTLVNNSASLLFGVAGVVLLLGWWGRRHDQAALWFAIACLLWSLRGWLYQRFVINSNIMLFEQANPWLIALTALSLCAATLHMYGAWTPRWSKAMAVWSLSITLVFAATVWFERGAGAIRALAFVSSLGFFLALSIWLWRLHSRGMAQAALLASGITALLLGAIHDIGMVVGWSAADNWSLLTPAFAIMLILYGGVLFFYFLRQLRDAERSNELLEERVLQKTRELEASQALLRSREVEQARAQERSLFQREMHDGLGSHLLSTLRGLQLGTLTQPQVTQALQEGLDEMRLIINSADQGQGLFLSALSWRGRWEPRLEALGIELAWHLDERIEHLVLDVPTVLQWLRVMQEAVTNVIKHASASQLMLHWQLDTTAERRVLRLMVRDNGSGMPAPGASSQGRGLFNITERARQLGAQVLWENIADSSPGESGVVMQMWATIS